jgi:hypothetical protein
MTPPPTPPPAADAGERRFYETLVDVLNRYVPGGEDHSDATEAALVLYRELAAARAALATCIPVMRESLGLRSHDGWCAMMGSIDGRTLCNCGRGKLESALADAGRAKVEPK